MPYCNQCGRYIGGGMLCAWCGEANVKTEEDNCRGLDGLPTPDGAAMRLGEDTRSGDEEMPGNSGTASADEGEEPAEMPVTDGAHVPGDVTGEVVSEGRTIVTAPEEDTHEECPPSGETKHTTGSEKRSFGARLGAKLGEWMLSVFSPREGEDAFPPHEKSRGRGMAVLCYMGVLWAIPYFCARSSRYVSYHLARGLNLLLLDCLGLTLGAMALALGVVMTPLMPLVAAAAEVVLLGSVSMSIWSIVRLFAVERVAQQG